MSRSKKPEVISIINNNLGKLILKMPAHTPLYISGKCCAGINKVAKKSKSKSRKNLTCYVFNYASLIVVDSLNAKLTECSNVYFARKILKNVEIELTSKPKFNWLELKLACEFSNLETINPLDSLENVYAYKHLEHIIHTDTPYQAWLIPASMVPKLLFNYRNSRSSGRVKPVYVSYINEIFEENWQTRITTKKQFNSEYLVEFDEGSRLVTSITRLSDNLDCYRLPIGIDYKGRIRYCAMNLKLPPEMLHIVKNVIKVDKDKVQKKPLLTSTAA